MKRYIFFALYFILALAHEVNAQTISFPHPWAHKRVAYFGDSITDPNNDGSKLKFWNFLEDWLGITPYIYGVSGRQWDNIST